MRERTAYMGGVNASPGSKPPSGVAQPPATNAESTTICSTSPGDQLCTPSSSSEAKARTARQGWRHCAERQQELARRCPAPATILGVLAIRYPSPGHQLRTPSRSSTAMDHTACRRQSSSRQQKDNRRHQPPATTTRMSATDESSPGAHFFTRQSWRVQDGRHFTSRRQSRERRPAPGGKEDINGNRWHVAGGYPPGDNG
jgi:hypothetical protein